MSGPLNPTAAPFVPATPSPPSLDTLTVAEDPPVAPWHRLPVELKRKIVDEVLKQYEPDQVEPDAVDKADKAVGFFARRRALWAAADDAANEKRRELERLQAVSRDFRSICEPLLWQRIMIEDLCPARLDNLLDVIPPHASLVRCIDLTFFNDEYGDHKRSDLNVRSEVRRRVRELLGHCFGLQELILDEMVLELSAVVASGLRIVDLRTGGLSVADLDGVLAALSKQASLESLGLRVDEGSDELRVALVGDIVSRLSSLKHLQIVGDDIFDERCLELAPGAVVTARLESLELYGLCARFDFAALQAFVALFSTSLVDLRLELQSGLAEQWSVPSSTPDFRLPHLTSLALGSDFDSAFFLRLDLPSLSFFRLGLFPSLGENIADLVAFLRTHARTLKHVHLAHNSIAPEVSNGELDSIGLFEADIEEVKRVCLDIECEFSIGDADDDGEDDDGEDDDREDDSDSYDSEYEQAQREAMEMVESDEETVWFRYRFELYESEDSFSSQSS
ncbi:hypothetical protein JCM3775_000088 [Rhodotorula graminis]